MSSLLTINVTIDEIKEKSHGSDEPQFKRTEQLLYLVERNGTAPSSPGDGNLAPNVTKSAIISVLNPTLVHPLFRRDIQIV